MLSTDHRFRKMNKHVIPLSQRSHTVENKGCHRPWVSRTNIVHLENRSNQRMTRSRSSWTINTECPVNVHALRNRKERDSR